MSIEKTNSKIPHPRPLPKGTLHTVVAVWHVYILQCADGSLYTGATLNLEKRIQKHNAGTGATYTRSRLPVTLLYAEICKDMSIALKREYQVKQFSRKEKLSLIATHAVSQAHL